MGIFIATSIDKLIEVNWCQIKKQLTDYKHKVVQHGIAKCEHRLMGSKNQQYIKMNIVHKHGCITKGRMQRKVDLYKFRIVDSAVRLTEVWSNVLEARH